MNGNVGIAPRVEPHVVALDPYLLNKIQPIKILEGKWANNAPKIPSKEMHDITNLVTASVGRPTQMSNMEQKK